MKDLWNRAASLMTNEPTVRMNRASDIFASHDVGTQLEINRLEILLEDSFGFKRIAPEPSNDNPQRRSVVWGAKMYSPRQISVELHDVRPDRVHDVRLNHELTIDIRGDAVMLAPSALIISKMHLELPRRDNVADLNRWLGKNVADVGFFNKQQCLWAVLENPDLSASLFHGMCPMRKTEAPILLMTGLHP